jgi:transcriptional regulator with XRE-family HTH domain
MDSAVFETKRSTLAANLRAWRLRRGLSQEALALEAEVDRTFVSQIERGVGNPSLRILCKLAEQLEVDVAVLLKSPRIRK